MHKNKEGKSKYTGRPCIGKSPRIPLSTSVDEQTRKRLDELAKRFGSLGLALDHLAEVAEREKESRNEV